ncbi:MAG: glycosyltransferase, partial [Firmicutes bacterium]|nr:glycosyltransferase [Bacillota bacterium]
MSIIWISSGILFYFRREKTPSSFTLDQFPMVSILIPCFNEAETIVDTIHELQPLTYPNYEIIIINDGSKDRSLHHLKVLIEMYQNVRIINLKMNRGKANALKIGVMASLGQIIISLDADSVLDRDAIQPLVMHFIRPGGERVGAVTGNPRVRNRSSLLAKIQLVEYSSIIGLIKRSQRILGKIMTVSGVIVAFRKRALIDCGLWDIDLITDDIGVSWKLQRRFWDIRYEPTALCWMLVPETVTGLWKQRIRWAQGGIEVLMRHWKIIFSWKQRRFIPILLEQIISILWSFCWLISTVIIIGQMIFSKHYYVPIFWTGTYLAI